MLSFPFSRSQWSATWPNAISPSESCRCRARPIPRRIWTGLIAHVREAARQGAELICLPELFQTQYFCQREDTALFELAEPIPGPATERLGELTRELKITLIASLFERRAAGVYHNTAAILGPDGELKASTARCTFPTIRSTTRSSISLPGDLGFKTFEASFGKFGTLVCWDQWYPEGARLTAAQGANVLFYPTAIGWHPDEKAQYGEAQYDAWRTIQRSHAIANGVYVAAVNRVGFETGNIRGNEAPGKGLEFWGGSFIADPFGQVIAQAPHDKEAILLAEVDLHRIEDVRRNWPFWRDRRIDAYGAITQRFLV